MATREVTDVFKQQVRDAWPQGSNAVAEAASNEPYRHGDVFDLDHDGQVSLALKIGVMAGETRSSGPESFIERFQSELLNE